MARDPAPSASLARVERPDAVPTRLSRTAESTTVTPPAVDASAGGERKRAVVPVRTRRADWHGLGRRHAVGGDDELRIVTVAPPVKFWSGGISTPPPAANIPSSPMNGIDSGLDRVTPPLILTPSMATVG